MNETAKDFLGRCFTPGSTIALLLRTESTGNVRQRVVTLEQVLAPRYLGWLTHQNRDGANIYVAANPLRSGSRRRTKESIESICHVYLDIDDDGEARLAALRASDAVPRATAILSTSPGKYQVFWRVEGFDFEQQELTLKRLAIVFGGDPACTDCNRVLRIPGFLNLKYSPAHRVAAEYGSSSVWTPSDFKLDSIADEDALPSRGPTRSSARKDSHSEQDWAWVCSQLASGKDADKLTHLLASRRSDKANPFYYAQRTIDVASARQWLLDGVSQDDVVSRLYARRQVGLSAARCSARALEIATTAQRMVVRRNFA